MKRETLWDVPLSEIMKNKNNPRVNETAVEPVKKSISNNDYISPIIVDEKNTILAGHTRLQALSELGFDKIPLVIKVSGLTEEQKKDFLVRDNKTTEFAGWDVKKLKELFGDMVLTDMGFNVKDIDKAIMDMNKNVEVAFDVERGRDYILVVCESTEDFVYLIDKFEIGQVKELSKGSSEQGRAVRASKVIEKLK